MFRMWAKLVLKNRIIRHTTVCSDDLTLNRTRKVYQSIDEICEEFDVMHPIWLKSNIEEFKRYSRCRFGRDCFMEEVSFDYLEIQVIEEDW